MSFVGNHLLRYANWISQKFKTDDSTALSKDTEHFPFSMTAVNKQLRDSSEQLTFYGFPIENVWANYREGSKYELHFLLHLEDSNKVVSLVEQMGSPENWTKEEIEADEFDILCWFIGDIYITLGRSYFSREDNRIPDNKRYSLYKVGVTNAKHGELPGPEAISR